jgi:hypothetical protein
MSGAMSSWRWSGAFLDACRDLHKKKAKMENLYRDLAGQIEILFEVIAWEVL